MPADRPPSATYRIQLQPEFGFAAAAGAVPYLADLGVSHLYLSPVLQAAPGSRHGYDVVDHTRLSAELGGEPAWARLVTAAREAGLGIVVDVVPNHMALPAPEWLNRPLWDVLQHGRDATHAEWFDIDWEAGEGRLVLPVLGAPDDAPRLEPSAGPGGEPVLRYHDHAFPIAPGSERLAGGALLEAQPYRLVYWRERAAALNYRRFFDVSTLIAVRVEDPRVFDATHDLLVGKVAAGEISGLRIDHPDGLADPAGYLDRLRAAAPTAWIVVEKILGPDEELRTQWPVAGTTGYDALGAITRAFVDPAAAGPLTEIYARHTGVTAGFTEVAWAAKRETAAGPLRAEAERIARSAGPGTDPGIAGDLLAAWPVYRSYVPPGGPASQGDEQVVAAARDRASSWRPAAGGLIDTLCSLVRDGAGEFAVRFQQTTGMVMAKGVEDTAFYRYHRLAALAEVGGDPGTVGADLSAWHGFAERLARDWPATMTTLTTHDTKRSEDVRARLLVLAEIPDAWDAAISRWQARAAAPDPNLGYLFWQTLVGAWPICRERATRYLDKAAREAKQRTSWVDPDPDFDAALNAFVAAVFDDEDVIRDVAAFAAALEPAATALSLGQKLVQLTMPGVPDIYQGAEAVCRTLVDPDNRAPLDLARLVGANSAKQRLTRAVLHRRRAHPEWFGPAAGYQPLAAAGLQARHVLAFIRGGGAITIATRLPAALARAGGWSPDSRLRLPTGRWTDVLTGRSHEGEPPIGELLAGHPVGLLCRADG